MCLHRVKNNGSKLVSAHLCVHNRKKYPQLLTTEPVEVLSGQQ